MEYLKVLWTTHWGQAVLIGLAIPVMTWTLKAPFKWAWRVVFGSKLKDGESPNSVKRAARVVSVGKRGRSGKAEVKLLKKESTPIAFTDEEIRIAFTDKEILMPPEDKPPSTHSLVSQFNDFMDATEPEDLMTHLNRTFPDMDKRNAAKLEARRKEKLGE